MSLFTRAWFWMLIVSVIAIGLGVFISELNSQNPNGASFWGYMLISLGSVLLIIAIVLALMKFYSSKDENT